MYKIGDQFTWTDYRNHLAYCSFQVFDFAHKIGIRVDIMLFDYLILISSIYQYRLSMPKRNPSYKDDGPNEKLGKYSNY